MGASLVYLEEPDKTKHTEEGKSDLLSYAACSMQGWRLNQVSFLFSFAQEDAHISNLEFDTDTILFAVFDGHGGEIIFP